MARNANERTDVASPISLNLAVTNFNQIFLSVPIESQDIPIIRNIVFFQGRNLTNLCNFIFLFALKLHRKIQIVAVLFNYPSAWKVTALLLD